MPQVEMKVQVTVEDAGPGPVTPSLNAFADLAIDLDAAMRRHSGARTGEELKAAHESILCLLVGERATILTALRIASVAVR